MSVRFPRSNNAGFQPYLNDVLYWLEESRQLPRIRIFLSQQDQQIRSSHNHCVITYNVGDEGLIWTPVYTIKEECGDAANLRYQKKNDVRVCDETFSQTPRSRGIWQDQSEFIAWLLFLYFALKVTSRNPFRI